MYMVAEDVVFRRVFLYDPFPFNSPPSLSLSLFSVQMKLTNLKG